MGGTRVYCSKSSTASKTSLTVQLCEELQEGNTFTRVGCHPALAEKISKKLLEDRLLTAELGVYDTVSAQQTFGNSRVDFVLTSNDVSEKKSKKKKWKTIVEVKNVVGADYLTGKVPEDRAKVGVYQVTNDPANYLRAAIFPHGSHKPGIGVVSDRAIKVLSLLTFPEQYNTSL